MSKLLGDVSAYAYAVSKGYTGTEEEFAELMASYATVAESAEESRQAAEVAQGKAEDAQAAAETAQGVAVQAKDTAVGAKDTAVSAATTATTKAGEASSSASSASSSASAAAGSATSAASSASAASGSAATATTKAGEASNSATAAATAQTAAEDAQEAAENAAESVSASAAQIATNTADISDLKNAFNSLFIYETAYPTVYRAGYIRNNGIFGDSTDSCRTGIMPLSTEYVTVTFKTGYKGKIAEYANNESSSSFVKFIKSTRSGGSTSFVADTNKFYAFDVFAESGVSVTPSNIPSDAVTIIYHHLTDETLLLSGKAADAEIVGQHINDIKNKLMVSETYSSDLWEQGSITASTGDNVASTKSIRTIDKIPVSVDMEKFLAENSFEFNVYGWSGLVYLGYWNGSEFKTTGSALPYYSTEKEISPMRAFSVTHVRIVMRKTSEESATPSEGNNFSAISPLPLKNLGDIETIKNILNLRNSPYNHGQYNTKKVNYSDYYIGQQSDYSAFGIDTKYSEVLGAFDTLMSDSNGYITKNTLGTASGTDLEGNPYTIYEYVFKPKQKTFKRSDKKTPKIYMDGSIHGFEKNSTYGLYYFLKDVVENWFKVRPLEGIRNSVELHIIPVVNPWGFDRNEYVNGNGVNINRNFAHPGEWTVVTTPDTEVNGLSAFDQPESAIIRDWLIADENDILMYFNCHTNGRTTTGYAEMNLLMTSNDRNDQYFNKLFDAFIRQINRQSIRLPLMYPLIQPNTSEMCGTITSSMTANSTKGTASSWADTMETMLAMTLEVFNGLCNSDGVTVIQKYSDDSKKICSEIIGNVVINVLLEYSII